MSEHNFLFEDEGRQFHAEVSELLDPTLIGGRGATRKTHIRIITADFTKVSDEIEKPVVAYMEEY